MVSHESIESRGVFGGICLLLFASVFLIAGPWAGFHGVLFAAFGLLILLRPSQIRLPAAWWVLAIAFLITACSAFLPASWFHSSPWRSKLESLGLDTGSLVVIQSRMAIESLVLFAVTIFVGFWMAGHRPAAFQTRLWALVFTIGVACYAVISKIAQDLQMGIQTPEGYIFGFFQNRNHTATYLSMGAICGLGCSLQAMRDKRFVVLAVALIASAVCLWAIATWSISRAGIVLVAIGGMLWILMLGRRYLGRHGLWAVGLLVIVSSGLFLIPNTKVKGRIIDTVIKTDMAVGEDSALDSIQQIDLRIPIFLDTFDLIRDYPWTGIGAGQYKFIIPQYRDRTIIANDFPILHPESDWFWMASEAGIPATLCLLVLVVLVVRKSLKDVLTGRDRALRAACFVAALLVPIHGIFDVPGHQISLAWTAAFLVVLSLNATENIGSETASPVWLSRLTAVFLLGISVFLICAQWGGVVQPAHTVAQAVTREVMKPVREQSASEKTNDNEGNSDQTDQADDAHDHVLGLIRAGSDMAPLDCGLLRLESAIALKSEDEYPIAERAGALELAMDPSRIEIPLRQAAEWIEIDPLKTKDLWQEAMDRAERVDALSSRDIGARKNTLRRIAEQKKGRPEVEGWIPSESWIPNVWPEDSKSQ